jgi:hypothetical protein
MQAHAVMVGYLESKALRNLEFYPNCVMCYGLHNAGASCHGRLSGVQSTEKLRVLLKLRYVL